MPAKLDSAPFVHVSPLSVASAPIISPREHQARMLLARAEMQLSLWQWKYGKHNPAWLPPSGDVELSEDIHAWIAGTPV